ncbi:hypothetical protein CBR_g29444 [Chara braunii]|uniref:Uncharacterized protein n=1 Tax=Chara braunii TaxID=69332 RepID=A0A388LAI3_CHABU|nr:hypothetical protein CBR_g29444 [Chara braunii]|eukprot:GBG79294.1 hypothetical protein CBR_g29444 [Chara braunii]
MGVPLVSLDPSETPPLIDLLSRRGGTGQLGSPCLIKVHVFPQVKIYGAIRLSSGEREALIKQHRAQARKQRILQETSLVQAQQEVSRLEARCEEALIRLGESHHAAELANEAKLKLKAEEAQTENLKRMQEQARFELALKQDVTEECEQSEYGCQNAAEEVKVKKAMERKAIEGMENERRQKAKARANAAALKLRREKEQKHLNEELEKILKLEREQRVRELYACGDVCTSGQGEEENPTATRSAHWQEERACAAPPLAGGQTQHEHHRRAFNGAVVSQTVHESLRGDGIAVHRCLTSGAAVSSSMPTYGHSTAWEREGGGGGGGRWEVEEEDCLQCVRAFDASCDDCIREGNLHARELPSDEANGRATENSPSEQAREWAAYETLYAHRASHDDGSGMLDEHTHDFWLHAGSTESQGGTEGCTIPSWSRAGPAQQDQMRYEYRWGTEMGPGLVDGNRGVQGGVRKRQAEGSGLDGREGGAKKEEKDKVVDVVVVGKNELKRRRSHGRKVGRTPESSLGQVASSSPVGPTSLADENDDPKIQESRSSCEMHRGLRAVSYHPACAVCGWGERDDTEEYSSMDLVGSEQQQQVLDSEVEMQKNVGGGNQTRTRWSAKGYAGVVDCHEKDGPESFSVENGLAFSEISSSEQGSEMRLADGHDDILRPSLVAEAPPCFVPFSTEEDAQTTDEAGVQAWQQIDRQGAGRTGVPFVPSGARNRSLENGLAVLGTQLQKTDHMLFWVGGRGRATTARTPEEESKRGNKEALHKAQTRLEDEETCLCAADARSWMDVRDSTCRTIGHLCKTSEGDAAGQGSGRGVDSVLGSEGDTSGGKGGHIFPQSEQSSLAATHGSTSHPVSIGGLKEDTDVSILASPLREEIVALQSELYSSAEGEGGGSRSEEASKIWRPNGPREKHGNVSSEPFSMTRGSSVSGLCSSAGNASPKGGGSVRTEEGIVSEEAWACPRKEAEEPRNGQWVDDEAAMPQERHENWAEEEQRETRVKKNPLLESPPSDNGHREGVSSQRSRARRFSSSGARRQSRRFGREGFGEIGGPDLLGNGVDPHKRQEGLDKGTEFQVAADALERLTMPRGQLRRPLGRRLSSELRRRMNGQTRRVCWEGGEEEASGQMSKVVEESHMGTMDPIEKGVEIPISVSPEKGRQLQRTVSRRLSSERRRRSSFLSRRVSLDRGGAPAGKAEDARTGSTAASGRERGVVKGIIQRFERELMTVSRSVDWKRASVRGSVDGGRLKLHVRRQEPCQDSSRSRQCEMCEDEVSFLADSNTMPSAKHAIEQRGVAPLSAAQEARTANEETAIEPEPEVDGRSQRLKSADGHNLEHERAHELVGNDGRVAQGGLEHCEVRPSCAGGGGIVNTRGLIDENGGGADGPTTSKPHSSMRFLEEKDHPIGGGGCGNDETGSVQSFATQEALLDEERVKKGTEADTTWLVGAATDDEGPGVSCSPESIRGVHRAMRGKKERAATAVTGRSQQVFDCATDPMMLRDKLLLLERNEKGTAEEFPGKSVEETLKSISTKMRELDARLQRISGCNVYYDEEFKSTASQSSSADNEGRRDEHQKEDPPHRLQMNSSELGSSEFRGSSDVGAGECELCKRASVESIKESISGGVPDEAAIEGSLALGLGGGNTGERDGHPVVEVCLGTATAYDVNGSRESNMRDLNSGLSRQAIPASLEVSLCQSAALKGNCESNVGAFFLPTRNRETRDALDDALCQLKSNCRSDVSDGKQRTRHKLGLCSKVEDSKEMHASSKEMHASSKETHASRTEKHESPSQRLKSMVKTLIIGFERGGISQSAPGASSARLASVDNSRQGSVPGRKQRGGICGMDKATTSTSQVDVKHQGANSSQHSSIAEGVEMRVSKSGLRFQEKQGNLGSSSQIEAAEARAVEMPARSTDRACVRNDDAHLNDIAASRAPASLPVPTLVDGNPSRRVLAVKDTSSSAAAQGSLHRKGEEQALATEAGKVGGPVAEGSVSRGEADRTGAAIYARVADDEMMSMKSLGSSRSDHDAVVSLCQDDTLQSSADNSLSVTATSDTLLATQSDGEQEQAAVLTLSHSSLLAVGWKDTGAREKAEVRSLETLDESTLLTGSVDFSSWNGEDIGDPEIKTSRSEASTMGHASSVIQERGCHGVVKSKAKCDDALETSVPGKGKAKYDAALESSVPCETHAQTSGGMGLGQGRVDEGLIKGSICTGATGRGGGSKKQQIRRRRSSGGGTKREVRDWASIPKNLVKAKVAAFQMAESSKEAQKKSASPVSRLPKNFLREFCTQGSSLSAAAAAREGGAYLTGGSDEETTKPVKRSPKSFLPKKPVNPRLALRREMSLSSSYAADRSQLLSRSVSHLPLFSSSSDAPFYPAAAWDLSKHSPSTDWLLSRSISDNGNSQSNLFSSNSLSSLLSLSHSRSIPSQEEAMGSGTSSGRRCDASVSLSLQPNANSSHGTSFDGLTGTISSVYDTGTISSAHDTSSFSLPSFVSLPPSGIEWRSGRLMQSTWLAASSDDQTSGMPGSSEHPHQGSTSPDDRTNNQGSKLFQMVVPASAQSPAQRVGYELAAESSANTLGVSPSPSQVPPPSSKVLLAASSKIPSVPSSKIPSVSSKDRSTSSKVPPLASSAACPTASRVQQASSKPLPACASKISPSLLKAPALVSSKVPALSSEDPMRGSIGAGPPAIQRLVSTQGSTAVLSKHHSVPSTATTGATAERGILKETKDLNGQNEKVRMTTSGRQSAASSAKPGTSVTGMNSLRRSVIGMEGLRRSVTGVEALRRSVTGVEAPRTGVETSRRSAGTGVEALTRSVTGVEALRRLGTTGVETLRRSGTTGVEASRRCGTGADVLRRSVTGGFEASRRSVTGVESLRRSVTGVESLRRSVTGVESLRRSVTGAEMIRESPPSESNLRTSPRQSSGLPPATQTSVKLKVSPSSQPRWSYASNENSRCVKNNTARGSAMMTAAAQSLLARSAKERVPGRAAAASLDGFPTSPKPLLSDKQKPALPPTSKPKLPLQRQSLLGGKR